ncbi:hypothetical protein CH275_03125 [Rhodococcus sp. 06-235-1A]|uniref:hypothetical protein n=1 Tax=Rhodococcus sp. 06-235-1A TaxID=2022508 RepID=UPI000B9A5C59|nr:hypothetical protein [Rhodococcus sp. 06-235-1A]OZD09230.1 hypothetical protein CH275_03125 [Rhodococcus sp. 06-235-1A]
MAELVKERSRPISLAAGELLALRQWRWDAEKLQESAELDYDSQHKENGSPPSYYSISVFAMARGDDEQVPELIERLTTHVLAKRSSAHMMLITESELSAGGFTLIKHEPPEHHYDIPVGTDRRGLRVEDLANAFGLDEKIRMPR